MSSKETKSHMASASNAPRKSAATQDLTAAKAWQALTAHRTAMDKTHIRDLFAANARRFEEFSIEHNGLLFDYSKHRITAETRRLLIDLAHHCDVEGWRRRMFEGEKINSSENRAVLHTALRRPAGAPLIVDGEDIMPFIHDMKARMKKFSTDIRNGTHKGHSGRPIKTIINIGIGGSDLGPRTVCRALENNDNCNISVRFVSNIDAPALDDILAQSDPETTLFLIASKTFTTQETMTNARCARAWLVNHYQGNEDAVAPHFAALSTNEQAARDFGIPAGHIFPFRDWVGGRYSLWSAIGLPICLAAGYDNFEKLLAGAHNIDEHFRTAPLAENIPVMMALLGIWYRNFWDVQSHAVLPYAQNLEYLPDWLQQLDMESNGKNIDRDGRPTDYDTGPVIFGQPGTDGQHAFYQLLHQGTNIIPCDFIGFTRPHADLPAGDTRHEKLMANMVAQSQALMAGRTLQDSGGDLQKSFNGNRPSTTMIAPRLDAYHLGMLMALYEHKIFVQGVIWNINSFDQWGVELGKILTRDILSGQTGPKTDSSTKGLLDYLGRRKS